ncbi:MAG: response regulator [Chloroflexaceae bacterium]
MIRVFIADDHPIVREGMRSLIKYQTDMTLVGEADDGSQVLSLIATLTPDVALIDLRMPRLGGLDVLRRLREKAPVPACLVLSSYDEPAYVIAAIEAGARGYLLKHSAYAAILDAIRAVARGEHVISPALVGTLFTSVRICGGSECTGKQAAMPAPCACCRLWPTVRLLLRLARCCTLAMSPSNDAFRN